MCQHVTDLRPLARRRPRARLGLLAPARGPNRARALLAPVAPVRVARAALTEDGLGRKKFEKLQNQWYNSFKCYLPQKAFLKLRSGNGGKWALC